MLLYIEQIIIYILEAVRSTFNILAIVVSLPQGAALSLSNLPLSSHGSFEGSIPQGRIGQISRFDTGVFSTAWYQALGHKTKEVVTNDDFLSACRVFRVYRHDYRFVNSLGAGPSDVPTATPAGIFPQFAPQSPFNGPYTQPDSQSSSTVVFPPVINQNHPQVQHEVTSVTTIGDTTTIII